jgi:hypothetical protein
MMVGENLTPGQGLNPNDRIFLTISGSRPGTKGAQAGPVEISRGAFDYMGRAIDPETGRQLGPDVQPLTLKVDGLPAYPEFPCDAADAEPTAAGKARIAREYATAVEKINRQAGAGNTVEDAILDAVVDYCVNHLGFAQNDAPDRFIVKKRELALTKQIMPAGGALYTVRHAARFGS